MVMPYNLRKISRYTSEMASNEPRCTYACTSSSSSSCSSSQSSESPSPTNMPITQDDYKTLPDASKLVFSQHLTFEDEDEEETESDDAISDEECNNGESSSNFTLVDHEISVCNETLQNLSPSVTNWFSNNYECNGIRTRSRSRSQNVELKSAAASNTNIPNQSNLRMSPKPPTSSGIQTRSSRSNSINTAITSLIPVNKGMNTCQTRAASTRLPAKSRLPVAAKPLNSNNTENSGVTDLPVDSSRRIVFEILKTESKNIPLTVDGRERKSSITQPKLIKKKRQSLTVQLPNEDNDHDEDSCDERISDETVSITRTSRVSFQISTDLESGQPMAKRRTGRTPPHKKFRKLRLYDTPQTPKTLLKKAQPILDTTEITTTTTAITNVSNKKQPLKKLLTANEVIKAVVKASPVPLKPLIKNTKTVIHNTAQQMRPEPISTPLVEQKKESIVALKPTINNNSMSSPPRNQNFQMSSNFNEIHQAVHQTPKSSRRATPGCLLKAPIPMNHNSSPEYSGMDVDQAEIFGINRANIPVVSTNSSMKPGSLTASAHARRLFDFNRNGSDMSSVIAQSSLNMNKKLQFDDSDCEDSELTKTQAKSLSYESDDLPERPSAVSPVSSTSSWCGPNTQYIPQHLAKLKTLSSSSNSLFKPISRFIGVGLGTTGLSCSSSGGLNSLRSPNSPFQLNHVANINPFTPTNAFAGSSTANIITNLPTNNTNQTLLDNINSLKDYKSHGSNKRCFNEEAAYENDSTDMDLADSNSADSLGQSHSNNINNTDTNTVPRNKRLALRQCLVSRYHEEFHEVCKLGNGEFGDVFKCINRLDGCTYAIKRSKKPIAGSALEVAAWKEVCAHAVLVKHSHIVQYYSAWAEADRMLIQNEYCNGGSLAEFIEGLRTQNFNASHRYQEHAPTSPNSSSLMNEYDLKLLLLHIAKGLAYMHSLNLVHLDIKPGNIFICRAPKRQHAIQEQASTEKGVVINEESGIESEGFDDDDDDACALTISNKTKHSGPNNASFSIFSDVITYKIGDLGHVTSTLDPHVEEGDCRYLPNEILQEQYDHLPKADVFALALTVLVCGTLEELPKNGDDWHWIRQGNFKDMPQCNDRFKKLLTQMIDVNPVVRPSASTLIHHPCIVPDASKSKSQLRKELNQEKFKNEMLKLKVQRYEEQLTNVKDTSQATGTTLNGKKINLSSLNSSSKFARSVSSTLL